MHKEKIMERKTIEVLNNVNIDYTNLSISELISSLQRLEATIKMKHGNDVIVNLNDVEIYYSVTRLESEDEFNVRQEAAAAKLKREVEKQREKLAKLEAQLKG